MTAATQAINVKARLQGVFAGTLCVITCSVRLSLATQVDTVESRLQGLSDLGLTDRAIADMLSRMPALLRYQSKQLQAMRGHLEGLAGLSHANVASLLRKEPRILSYSVAGVLGDFFYALLWMCPQQLPAEPSSTCL